MMKENKLRLLLNVCLFFVTLSAQAALHDTLFVAAYGVHPNTYEDQTARLQTLIADCKRWKSKVIVFQSGRYDLWPTDASRREYYISNTSSETECSSKVKTIGILFEEMSGLTIEGCAWSNGSCASRLQICDCRREDDVDRRGLADEQTSLHRV